MVNGENRFEQIIGMVLLFLLVIGCFVVLRPFVSALLLALILSYATWPIYVWNKRMLKRPERRGSIVGFFVSTMGMGLIFHGLVEAIQTYEKTGSQ